MKRVIATIAILTLGVISFTVWKVKSTHNEKVVDNNEVEIIKETMTNENSKPDNETKIQVRMNEKTYTVTMFDNPAANELLEQLPLTLEFSDYNGQEKGAKAPAPLSIEGVPDSDRGHLNDFVYYKPNNSLVFCYTDIGKWNGIVRLGTFDTSIEEIRTLPDGFTVTIEKI